jgi:hypothetical protein
MTANREYTVLDILGEKTVEAKHLDYFIHHVTLKAPLTINQQNELARQIKPLREMGMDGLRALADKLYVRADFDAFDQEQE